MSTTGFSNTLAPPLFSPEVRVKMEQAIRRAMAGERDPEAMRKAFERMDRTREEIHRRHGVLDIGVPAIRELRE
jgi:hypothetical protein